MSFREWANTVVGQAAAVGSQPSDTPDQRLRKSALVLSSLLITTLSFIWVGTYAALGLWRSALIPFAYQVASLVGLVFFARTKRYPPTARARSRCSSFSPSSSNGASGIRGVERCRALGVRRAPRRARLLWTPAGDRLVRRLPRSGRSFRGDRWRSPEPAEPIPSSIVVAFFALNILGPAVVTFALLEYFVRPATGRTGFWPRSRSGRRSCF